MKNEDTIIQAALKRYNDWMDTLPLLREHGNVWQAMNYIFIKELKEALRQERKEIAESIPILYMQWHKEIAIAYEKGSKTRKTQVLVSFPDWLQDTLLIEIEK